MNTRIDTVGYGEYRLPWNMFDLVLTFAAAYGIPRNHLLSSAGLDSNELLSSPRFVGIETYNDAILELQHSSKDPHLSLKFGMAMSNSSQGVFNLASQAASDLRSTYEIFPGMFSARTDQLQAADISEDRSTFTVSIASNRPNKVEQLARFHMIASLTSLVWLTRKVTGNESVEIEDEIEIEWSKTNVAIPEGLLPPGTKLLYDKGRNCLKHKKKHLSSKVLVTDNIQSTAPLHSSEKPPASPPRTNVEDKVRWVFRILYPAIPTLECVARRLFMSSATLKRKLSARGTSFQSIKSELRFARIVKLLESTNLTLDLIADEADFNNASNLTKAFKHRFGCTPAQYRHAQSAI